MDLYYALTIYHQLGCILHKMLINPESDAELFISDSITYSPGLIERIKDSGIFRDVRILKDSPAWSMGGAVNHANAKKTIVPALNAIGDFCFSLLPRPIEKYGNLYIFADHFPLGFSLAHKGIPYYYFEEASGAHSRRHILIELLQKKNPFLYWVFMQTGARGMARSIIKKYMDMDLQLENFEDPLAEDFSASKLLQQMTGIQMDLLLGIFNQQERIALPADRPSAIVFTQHFANMKVTSFEGQHLIYALLLDYFCQDMHVLIKKHPNDRQGLYSQWFPDATILAREFPSELLPYCIDGAIERGISATSSAAFNSGNLIKNRITFQSENNRFEFDFPYIHRYYIAARLIEMAGEQYTILGLGIDTVLLRALLTYHTAVSKARLEEIRDIVDIGDDIVENGAIIIVDQLEINRDGYEDLICDFMEKDNCILLFLDTKNDAVFLNPQDIGNVEFMLPIKIEKNPLHGLPVQDTETEWIYLHTKNDVKRRELIQTRIDKALERTGLHIRVDAGMWNIRETVLEGMLLAVEKRCRALIRQNKELEQALRNK